MVTKQQQEAKDGLAWIEQYIAELENENAYLDERLAKFEELMREFVEFKQPDHICRMNIKALLEE